MAQSLRIALWNANGILPKLPEVESFLKINNINVLLVTETHLTSKNYIKIPYYDTYHTEHPDGTAHGGTAIIIQSSLKHYELPKYAENFLQATSIQVHKLPAPITISSVYCPPRHHIKKDIIKPFFESLGNIFICGGDFNCKHTHWGSRLTTTKGRELYNLLQESNYQYLSTGEPTYWPTDPVKIPDLLDFFIVKGISNNFLDIESCLDLTSDHTPVIATISTTFIKTSPRPSLYNKETSWNRFRELLCRNLHLNIRLKTPDEIDEATEQFIRIVQDCAWAATPTIANKIRNGNNVPNEILQLVKQKRRARARWQRTRNPIDKNKFNRLANNLKRILKQNKEETYQYYLSNLSKTDHSIWKATTNSKRPQIIKSPIRKANNEWARSDQEKADTFAQHFEQVFTPHLDTQDPQINSFLEAPLQLSLPIKNFKYSEVKYEIDHLNKKKSPGYDLINGRVLSELPDKAIQYIKTLFNAILRVKYWPVQLKFAQLILIPKPGKPQHEVSSYRPISLLPQLSKVLEKLVLRRIHDNKLLEEILPDHQFGFRKHHSTIQQCHRVVSEINKAINSQEYCPAVYLDIQQAFDKVWYSGLLYKIKKKLPSEYYLLLKSYLCGRHFQVKYCSEFSDIFPIKSGVPQGSVLGPLLYTLYTSDIPTTPDTQMGTFADDTVLLCRHKDPQLATEGLQLHLDILQNWLHKWRIKVNEQKSTHVTHTLKRSECPPVYLNNVQIPQADGARYLGLHLDSKLTWKKHIMNKRKELDLKIKKMYWLFGKKSPLSLANKILLYKAVIKPVWTYGIELWGCSCKSNVNIIQRFQSKALRTIAGAPWYISNLTMHTDFNILLVEEECRTRAQKHFDRLQRHTNKLASDLTINDNTKRIKRKWPNDLRG